MPSTRHSLRALIAVLKEAGVEVTADYLLALIKIEEAARFLGTTKGELYHLTYRREIPFIVWGKRGKRFRRVDLIPWMEERGVSASTRLVSSHAPLLSGASLTDRTMTRARKWAR